MNVGRRGCRQGTFARLGHAAPCHGRSTTQQLLRGSHLALASGAASALGATLASAGAAFGFDAASPFGAA